MADKPKKLSNLTIGDLDKITAYLVNLDRDVSNIVQYLDQFPRMFTQATQPTLQRNTFAFWKDSGTGKFYALLDVAGTTKKVELT